MRNRKRVGWHRYINGVNISVVVTALFILIPLYWLIASSFKAPNSVGDSPPSLGPTPFSGGNYSNAFVGYDFGIYFRNSVIVCVSATALVLILGTLAGYALGLVRNANYGLDTHIRLSRSLRVAKAQRR